MDVQDIEKMSLEVKELKAELSEIRKLMLAIHDVFSQIIATQQAKPEPEQRGMSEYMRTIYDVPFWIKGN